ncbi:MAG TPA: ATP-dependent helicase HrpB [Holophagaceae bacterium]|nr:ATP-dependent helicase HrpB [Holophagaceae bacterium]
MPRPALTLPPLPIDPLLPELCASLRTRPNLVLSAEPGAGKTTRVPRALLEAGLLGDSECWILEPRRLAARLAASRVADEMGEALGGTVGYAVRFEQKVSKATRLRFVTEGLLLRRLQGDPALKGIAAVVLDEFHERHLHTDLALTLLRRLQRGARPDLKLLVMSATLDAGPIAAFLDAPAFRSEGRSFPIEQRHRLRPDDRPIQIQVRESVETLFAEGLKGHVLVFLPGAAEIRACLKECEATAQRLDLRLFPLHGELSVEAQQAALAPSPRPKVIFSTNVAESSVTLDGIAAVIDSGLGREARHSPWSGLSTLQTVRVSQARCVQRAGRSGRTGPGLCVRLFPQADFENRPSFDPPELQRADLAEALLGLHALGIGDPSRVHWFEAPPEAPMKAAEKLLRELDALDAGGALTSIGRRMLDLPLHPRLARLVVAGEDLGIPRLARLGAALLETGDLAARQGLDRRNEIKGPALESDLLLRVDQYHEAEAASFSAGACRAAGLDPGAVHRAKQAFHALERHRADAPEPADAEARLLRALLRAYPDRVARKGGGKTFALCEGGGAALGPDSRVQREDLILVLEATGSGASVTLRAASKLEADWILDAFPERLREEDVFSYNAARGRVEQVSGLWYGAVCLDETRRAADPSDPRAAALLAQAAQGRNLGEAFDRLLQRATFLRRHRPELELPEDLGNALLVQACTGLASLKELEATDWAWTFRARFGEAAAQLLDKWAPETIQLPKGRPAKIQYDGATPWVAARLQDFWGLKKGPTLAGGAVPLVLHLLAPNMRALQVTTDLAGFWERAYKELRPALSRRYPKHHWPE